MDSGSIRETAPRRSKRAIAAGLAGVGIEDTTADPQRPLHDFDSAVARVAAAAAAARGRIVLTGRTDNYLHDRPDLDDTIRRLVAFAEAGADVLYAPFLPTLDAIAAVVNAVAPKPVNVLIGPTEGAASLSRLSEIGVRRVSTGAALYLQAMATLADAADALRDGDLRAAQAPARSGEIGALFQLEGAQSVRGAVAGRSVISRTGGAEVVMLRTCRCCRK